MDYYGFAGSRIALFLHNPHPRGYSFPLGGWLTPKGQLFGPGQGFGLLLPAYRWQGSQKWVVPKQNQRATEQQYLHLNSIASVPCFWQLLYPNPDFLETQDPHTRSSFLNPPYYSWSPHSLMPPKYGWLHVKQV